MPDLHLGELVDPAAHSRTGEAVRLPTGDLTTHGIIVGMTGSGKTGLGIVLIEECLSAGIPTLLIDPKGDLGNLCLTFPQLSGPDLRPWVSESDAAASGGTADAFAEQQAVVWRDGLASWGIGLDRIAALRDRVAFTIYTPGSTAGVPLDIVGSLRAPGSATDIETMRDEVEGYVSGLLGLVGIEADPLSSREHILLSNLIETSWAAGHDLDLPTLVGQVQAPPMRKLGVFELDTFFPPADRTAFALRLNGLLASPAFSAWSSGTPLDVASMLHDEGGRPRCAIVSTAHLSEEERQFVTALLLGKVVTWMRRQSGTTDLRALVYIDEVAGYAPPTANPPTKAPIMTLMKQARAFGVGVVLATQNPVDLDYKALGNAGTWMIGRLQTERDKARLLDGMAAAAGGVDMDAVGATISGLAKREFVLRRAGKDTPQVFTTRWAMSYLRGPLTRDQITTLMADQRVQPPLSAPDRTAAAAVEVDPDATPVMPVVAKDVTVRFADPASAWLGGVGGDARGTRFEAAAVARVRMRFDDERADLVTDEEFEAVILPLGADAGAAGESAIPVDYDDRDLRADAAAPLSYRVPDAPIGERTYWSRLERSLVDHLVRSRTVEVPVNRTLKLYGRPGETPEQFSTRCTSAADALADAAVAKLRDKYEAQAKRLRDRIDAAQDRVEALETAAEGRRNEELLGAAGSILGGLLGGRRSSRSMAGKMAGGLGTMAGRRSRSRAAGERKEAAEDKVAALLEDVESLEAELAENVARITDEWDAKAADVTSLEVSLERTDVEVGGLALVWVPVP